MFRKDAGPDRRTSKIAECPKVVKDAIASIKLLTKKRESVIHLVALEMMTLYHKHQTVGGPTIEWEQEVKLNYRQLKKYPIYMEFQNEPTKATNKRNLSILLLEFQNANSEDDAISVFNNQCCFCYWGQISFVDKKIYNELDHLITQLPNAKQSEIMSKLLKDGLNTLETLKKGVLTYIQALLVIGSEFPENKHYTDCYEEFFIEADEQFIINSMERFDTRWPNIPFAIQAHKFCKSFTTLYNRISNTNTHTPTYFKATCKPNSTHIYNFIDQISHGKQKHEKEDFLLIARFLGLIE